jgi:hypothetical protein
MVSYLFQAGGRVNGIPFACSAQYRLWIQPRSAPPGGEFRPSPDRYSGDTNSPSCREQAALLDPARSHKRKKARLCGLS